MRASPLPSPLTPLPPPDHPNPMRIALLRPRVRGPGGAEATVRHLARGLVAAGHLVTVYGVGSEPENAAALGPQIRYVRVPVGGGKTGRLLTYALNTRRLLRKTRPEVVFSLERTLFQYVYRAGDGCHREWLARRAPFLSPGRRLLQELSPFHRVMLWLERRLFASPELKRVLANSRQVKEEIVRHFQVDPEMIKVVYNGLDHDVFRPVAEAERRSLRQEFGVPEEEGIILFVGSGFARKGLAFLLEAVSHLKNEPVRLWIVGQDRLGYYQGLAQKLGVTAQVRFWGPQAEVARFYQAASLLALPTLYDPCSNVVLEALGCGCPVLTTVANGAAEFITPGANGEIMAQPNAIPVWVEALRQWLARSRDPGTSQAARDAVAHLSWDATVSQTLEVLEEAAAGG
jgi:UDP-glucose:(heptosyl)LPS alpha-1,3-glucosyltransferase